MVKVVLKSIVFFVFIFFFINFVSASFTLGKANYSIEKSYGPGNEISGWVNLSLNAQPSNSIFKASFGDGEYTISLFSLIKKLSNSNFIYTCDTFNCSSNYASTNSEASKSFSLNNDESKIVGLKINENKAVIDFSDFSLTLTGDSTTETTTNPLSIDILNDDKDEWVAHLPSETFSIAEYGCYKNTYTIRQANIPTEDRYCERVKLLRSPSVKIGANVIGTEAGDFIMTIEDKDGNSESCTATSDVTTGIASCVPLFQIQSKDNYFVCIQADQPGYQINFIGTNPSPCGFSGIFDGAYTSDFEIFAQTNGYAPVGTVVLDNAESELATGEAINIEGEIEKYISDRYENDCSKDCIIPIKITSGTNQGLTLSGAHLSYSSGGILIPGDMNLYDLSETPTKLTSGFQKLNLDEAKFNVPNEYGNYTFSLLLGSTKVFSQKIAVEKGPVIKYVSPDKTAVTYPTEFKVVLNASYNITRYSWDFGDGSKQNTTTNTVEYAYAIAGNYELRVTVTDTKDRSSSKKINVEVKPASEMVPVLLDKLKEDVANLKTQLTGSSFSQFEKDSINSSLNLDDMNTIFDDLETSISNAVSEEQFEGILGQIIELEVPKSIEKTASGSNSVFYSDAVNIDLAVLKEIGGGDYAFGNEEAYKNAVMAWEGENVATNLTFSEISAVYDSYTTSFLKTFEMEIKKTEGTPYLIMKKMENLFFGGVYSEQEVGDYVYITLDNPEEKISFSTTEEGIDFSNLPVFIAPKISELTVIEGEIVTPFEEGKMVLTNPGLFFTIVAIVILTALVVWVLLQIWYVKRYENYLFKNRNNLYNVVNYINASKKSGLSEKEIASKLKKSGWTSEQLQYALKKYNGKKTWFQRTFIDSKKIQSNTPQGNPQINSS